MALTSNTLPSTPPRQVVPFDAGLAFAATAAALTADGYLGAGAQVDIGPGRFDGLWAIDISAMKLSTTDEFYFIHLLGSNDVNFASGNIDILATRDFAALAANRILPTIAANSDAVPPTGLTSGRFVVPFTNFAGERVYRYLRAYVNLGGTSPSITLKSWIAPDCD